MRPPPTLGAGAGQRAYTVVAGDYRLQHRQEARRAPPTSCVNYNGWPDGTEPSPRPGRHGDDPAGLQRHRGRRTTATAAGAAPASPCHGGSSTGTTTAGSTTLPARRYTVKNGDTLVGIASQFGTTAQSIVAANGWSDGLKHVIYTGLKINLPRQADSRRRRHCSTDLAARSASVRSRASTFAPIDTTALATSREAVSRGRASGASGGVRQPAMPRLRCSVRSHWRRQPVYSGPSSVGVVPAAARRRAVQ